MFKIIYRDGLFGEQPFDGGLGYISKSFTGLLWDEIIECPTNVPQLGISGKDIKKACIFVAESNLYAGEITQHIDNIKKNLAPYSCISQNCDEQSKILHKITYLLQKTSAYFVACSQELSKDSVHWNRLLLNCKGVHTLSQMLKKEHSLFQEKGVVSSSNDFIESVDALVETTTFWEFSPIIDAGYM